MTARQEILEQNVKEAKHAKLHVYTLNTVAFESETSYCLIIK